MAAAHWLDRARTHSENGRPLSREMAVAHWLDRYGSQRGYAWRELGVVEAAFDHDGTDYEGRADIITRLRCRLTGTGRGTGAGWRRHVTLAWATLSAEHALLRASAVDAESHPALVESGLHGRCFLVRRPKSPLELVKEAERSLVIVQDFGYHEVDVEQFCRHAMNTARCFEPTERLSRLYLLPVAEDGQVVFVGVFAHQIMDGLTSMAWNAALIDLLNESDDALERRLESSCQGTPALPPAQEALYPVIGGSLAAQRWKWTIARILRHTRRPPLPSFRNPLRRVSPLAKAVAFPPTFARILDYQKVPPLNTLTALVTLPRATVTTFRRMCKEAKTSMGAGSFALLAMALCEIEEMSTPDQHLAFVAGFPLDPRPFIYRGPYDSIILAFSDGISLPFLPKRLPSHARFKLLARRAQAQLEVYQKRPRSARLEGRLGSQGQGQFIFSTYLSSVERLESKLPHKRKRGLSVQGAYPASHSAGSTCGISSIGDRTAFISRRYSQDGSQVYSVEYFALQSAVRARDGEFLVVAYGGEFT